MGQEKLVTEQDYLADIPVVLSATRLQQPRSDAPASITIIDRKMIEASGAIDIADLLRLVPGFQVGMANANIYAVTSHGLSYQFPRKLQVLIDGRSVYRPLLSNVDWVNLGIALNDIERIEVIRGPNVSVYGSNAFLGTVNIITKQPFMETGLYSEALAGGRQTRSGVLSYSKTLKRFGYRVSAQHREDNGFSDVNDGRNVNSASFRGTLDINATDSLDMQAGYDGGDLGAWGQEENSFNRPRNKQVKSYYGYIRWDRRISSVEDFHVQFYHNYYEQDDTITSRLLSSEFGVDPAVISLLLGGRPDQAIVSGLYDGKAIRSDIEIQHTFHAFENSRIVWGASYREDRMKSKPQLDRNDYVKDRSKRLFANIESKWQDSVVLNLGVMLEDSDIVKTKLSPRLGVNYHIDANNTVRFSATRAYRTPSLYEEYNNWSVRLSDGALLKTFYDSKGNLDPEKINSYEIGYLSTLPRYKTTMDLKLFREELKNMIVAPFDRAYVDSDFNLGALNSSSGAKVWQNGGYANTNGVELELQTKPGDGSLLHLSYAYANVSGQSLYRVNPDEYEDLSGHTPRHTASALLQYPLSQHWKASTAAYYVGKMEWGGDGDKVDSYLRFDLKLANNFRAFGGDGELAFVVYNVFNDKYHEFSNENIFERYGFIQLKFKI